MATSRFSALCWGCSVVLLLAACEEGAGVQAAAAQASGPEGHAEKGMMCALQEVLEKSSNNRLPPLEKKFGWVPSCDAGELCAVRKGARIGRLCSCPRGTSCNLHILKCL